MFRAGEGEDGDYLEIGILGNGISANMNSIVRNILAVVGGFLVGSLVNITLVNIGTAVVPLPEGAEVSTMEEIRESMSLFKPVNFVFPFLAHALGTLAGAFFAARLSGSHQMKFALGIGVLFLIGGVTMVVIVSGPLWFNGCDLVLAYIPMGYLGGVLGSRRRTSAG